MSEQAHDENCEGEWVKPTGTWNAWTGCRCSTRWAGEPTAAPTRTEAANRLWLAMTSGQVIRPEQADAVIDHVTDTALSLSAAAPTRPTREQVRAAILSAQPYIRPDPATDAVMALIGGDDA